MQSKSYKKAVRQEEELKKFFNLQTQLDKIWEDNLLPICRAKEFTIDFSELDGDDQLKIFNYLKDYCFSRVLELNQEFREI
jgi:hypothetical protein